MIGPDEDASNNCNYGTQPPPSTVAKIGRSIKKCENISVSMRLNFQ